MGEAFGQLAEQIETIADDVIDFKDFLGRKLACKLIDDMNLPGSDDDALTTLVGEIMGTAIACGITLGMRGETDEGSIASTADGLCEGLPDGMQDGTRAMIKTLSGRVIPYGIDFFHKEIRTRGQTYLDWRYEFEFFRAIERE